MTTLPIETTRRYHLAKTRLEVNLAKPEEGDFKGMFWEGVYQLAVSAHAKPQLMNVPHLRYLQALASDVAYDVAYDVARKRGKATWQGNVARRRGKVTWQAKFD